MKYGISLWCILVWFARKFRQEIRIAGFDAKVQKFEPYIVYQGRSISIIGESSNPYHIKISHYTSRLLVKTQLAIHHSNAYLGI